MKRSHLIVGLCILALGLGALLAFTGCQSGAASDIDTGTSTTSASTAASTTTGTSTSTSTAASTTSTSLLPGISGTVAWTWDGSVPLADRWGTFQIHVASSESDLINDHFYAHSVRVLIPTGETSVTYNLSPSAESSPSTEVHQIVNGSQYLLGVLWIGIDPATDHSGPPPAGSQVGEYADGLLVPGPVFGGSGTPEAVMFNGSPIDQIDFILKITI